jgi:hypothetical protein
MTATSVTTTPLEETGSETVRLSAHHRSIKRLGRWTTARRFDVRASRGSVVLDLLLPTIEAGEIEIDLDIDHSMVKLLVPDGANIDDDDLRRVGRGRVKDWTGTGAAGGRQIKLVGEMRNGEVRVHRGGVAILQLLLTRAHRSEVRQAHREGRLDYLADLKPIGEQDRVSRGSSGE